MPVSFEVGGGENVPGNPGACATRNFTYLIRYQFNLVKKLDLAFEPRPEIHISHGYIHVHLYSNDRYLNL